MGHWSFAVSGLVMGLALLMWLGSAWICYRHWVRSGHRRTVAWLEGLRFLLITVLGFTLLRPEFVKTIEQTEPPEIAVLLDASGSMATRDVVVSNQVVSRAEWLTQRKQDRFWAAWESEAKVVVEEFAQPPESTNATETAQAGTDLNRALEKVLQRQKNLKSVLLLTDGDWNTGKTPVGTATRYREEDVPIFAAVVGQEKPVPDLALERVDAPSYGLFGEQISIPFTVQNHLPNQVETEIALYRGDREVNSKPIVIPAESRLQDAILWSPREVGMAELRLELPVQPKEGLEENNRQDFQIQVRVETLNVLVIDSRPRWEYRYLRNALERDPGVEMQCLLYHPELGSGGGRHYLDAFPETKEMISRYDVIFLGDVGIGQGELTPEDAELIQGLVEQQASGLVLLPGSRGRQRTLLEHPIKELFPVELDPEQPEGAGLQNPARLLLTAQGKGHLLTRFDADNERNAEIWKQLPGFYWSAAVKKSRPGSQVLGVHSGMRNAWGRLPLLVTRSYGSGKVLFMGIDSAWRWRRGVEDKYHYRFWSQVVRWMAHQRHLSEKEGIRLSFSPEVPQAGQTVFLQATVLDQAGFPIDEGPVTGRITAPSGRTERLEFDPLEGGWGVFTSRFTPETGGDYQITVEAEQQQRLLTTDLRIEQPQVEKQGQPVNQAVLDEIADISGGESVPYESLEQVVQQIALLPEPEPKEQRIRLWSHPWWGALILVLLAVYWVGRKLAGMI